jgi:chemotaxis protein methyltransferase CheR
MAISPGVVTGDHGRPDGRVPEISEEEFALFQVFIRREAGIHLAPIKKSMLVGRLYRRLQVLKLRSFGEYYRHVAFGPPEERVLMLDAICTNETWFFRNRKQFDLLGEQLTREWRNGIKAQGRARTARVWSAACSTGEEPYSIAMVLLDTLPGWKIDILATDLSTRALEQARGATWSIEKSKDIPAHFLKRHMLRGSGTQEGKMRVSTALRALVRFERLNLNDLEWPLAAGGAFDAIFCRNVFMYFDPSDKERVVRRLLGHLAPGGHLFLGDAEGLSGFEDRTVQVMPAVYRLRGPAAPERGA